MGPEAAAAAPALLKASQDEDDPLSDRAGETLKRIDPAPTDGRT
jgi:hypothetical protein